jgi:glycosyltransferase involved in cell wall biosynthesis
MIPEKHQHLETNQPGPGSWGAGQQPEHPLVSVIIPCYNQGRFLSNAIRSALQQTYSHVEVIVINDGSTDETDLVARSFQEVRYFLQENRGLPAARNRGLEESMGHYIIFLDADDWLYPDAIEINLAIFRKNPELAFVSGGFSEVHDYGKTITTLDTVGHDRKEAQGHPIHEASEMYLLLLQGNCIGNPATVLYARWILDKVRFDQSGEVYGCEDYDHYLKIARAHPVIWHRRQLSFYRKHRDNMSADSSMMYRSAVKALQRQSHYTSSADELNALKKGINYWKKYYLFQYVGVHHRKIARSLISFGLINDASLDWAFIRECRTAWVPVLWKKIVRKTLTKLRLPIPESYYFL